jgi:hypothetical protein
MRPDEILMFLASLLALYANYRALRRYGGLRKCLEQFLSDYEPIEPVLLFLLLVPTFSAALYYFLLLLNLPWFETNSRLRESVIRPSQFSFYTIIALYFLNGRTVKFSRSILKRSVHMWKHLPTFRIW